MPPAAEVQGVRSGPLAFLATMIAPGLGHLYLGHPRVAYAILVALGVLLPLVVTAMAWLRVAPLATVTFAGAAAWGFALALAIDALVRARRVTDPVPARGRSQYVGFLLLSLVVGATASTLRKAYVIDTYAVPSGTMAPTIVEGDHIVVSKLHERGQTPARGDIIAFRYPLDPAEVFLKRVVAIGGDTVEDTPEGLVVNGVAWPRRPCAAEASPRPGLRCLVERAPDGREYTIFEGQPGAGSKRVRVTVAAGQLWVRGDHRSVSHDSTTFGAVPVEDVLGTTRAIFWPFDRRGSIE